jgi:hypothetical protein
MKEENGGQIVSAAADWCLAIPVTRAENGLPTGL